MWRSTLALLNRLVTSSGPPAQWTPAPDHEIAARCRRLLEESLVDFYLPDCVDCEEGGYLEDLDGDGKFAGGEKFLTLQARHLWFFSTLCVNGLRTDEALAAATRGYRFLRDHFHDTEHGGYFVRTARNGTPIDRRKHVYPNAFVIYALVEYHRASGEQAPLDEAIDLFRTLEARSHDRQHGGYHEFFYDDWRQVTDKSESGIIGAIGTKTYNSHLHLLEAFAQLFRETGDALVSKRLAELIHINTVTVRHPVFPCNIDGWLPDWTTVDAPRNQRVSFGHDVECCWLVLDAASLLGIRSSVLLGWARSLCDQAIAHGWDPKLGGFFYSGPLGSASDDRKKVWWTQAEALVAMLTLHRLTGEAKYRHYFARTLDFIETYQVSDEGGWWASLREDGSRDERRSRTSRWQGAYHNGRALLMCERMLQEQSSGA